jgi:hypothetical protein
MPSVELHRFTPCYFLPPALSPAFDLCLYQALLYLQPLSLLLPTLRSSALPGEVTAVDERHYGPDWRCGTLLGQASSGRSIRQMLDRHAREVSCQPAINQNTAACDQVYKSVFAHLEVYTATLP